MRLLGNILWHVPFLGFITAILTLLLGALLVILVIPAPLGFGLIELAKFEIAPFSYEMVNRKDVEAPKKTAASAVWNTYSTIIMIIYFPFGLLIALLTVFQIVFCFLSIIGIPVGIVLVKSLSTYLNPVNKICVPIGVGAVIARKKAEALMQKHTSTNTN